jgi:hypothetical protein
MPSSKLNVDQQQFVLANNDKLQVKEMAMQLNVYPDAILKFLRKNGLKSFFQTMYQGKTKILQLHHKKFIDKNYSQMTISEMARAIDNTNYSIYRYLTEKKLIPKKQHLVDKSNRPVRSVQQYDVVTQKFERPAAVYSNPNWNDL